MDCADTIWERFGDVRGYVEPFAGSLAVLLNRPQPFGGTETVNDLDGLLSNAWRAIRDNPDEVVYWADAPVSECDCHAEEIWLLNRKPDITAQLEADIEWSDSRAAGYWLHGICCWIGSGFCDGKGPWQVVDGKLIDTRQLPHLSNAGQGVTRQLPHLGNAGQGVNRKRPHLSNAGHGVNRQLPHLSDAELGGEPPATARGAALREYMRQLSARLDRVRICCGDWRRVCGGNKGDSLKHFFSGGNSCAVFLDPPYSAEADRCNTLYAHEDLSAAHDVREWAISQGHDERLRICLAGYDGEHNMPDDWEVVEWKTRGGYASFADGETNGKDNCRRERLWFSPHCIRPAEERLLF